ncbi:AMP-binding protein [Saccharothrix sp. MB29]|nr:AMP-binding protein [Saccharothrix sp. MB29]
MSFDRTRSRSSSASGAWAFADLDRESDRVAQVLRRRGIGLESRVGLCVARGFGMAVGVLGVLKSGAAYVPLDPSYPEGRLRWLAEDADVAAVLTESGLSGPWDGMPVVHLEDSAARSSLVGRPLHRVRRPHLGSTGPGRRGRPTASPTSGRCGRNRGPSRRVLRVGRRPAVDRFLADLLRSNFAGRTLIIARRAGDAGRLLGLIRHRWVAVELLPRLEGVGAGRAAADSGCCQWAQRRGPRRIPRAGGTLPRLVISAAARETTVDSTVFGRLDGWEARGSIGQPLGRPRTCWTSGCLRGRAYIGRSGGAWLSTGRR